MLRVVISGRVTIPSLQALLQISGVTGTLFSIIGVCWNFQWEYAPQYPLNLDTVPRHITPEVFFNFLGSGHRFPFGFLSASPLIPHRKFQVSGVVVSSLALRNQKSVQSIYLEKVPYSQPWDWFVPCSRSTRRSLLLELPSS